MTDRQLITEAAEEVAVKQGFTDRREMRQRDLEYLRECIEEKSGILISLSTIKRILNNQYDRQPQVATLNALAVYLGFADWQSYKAGKTLAVPRIPQPLTVARPAFFWQRSRLVAIVGVGFLLLFLLSWSYFSKSAKGAGTATFSVRKTTQNAIPNTVVFNYDVSTLAGDSFFIQQSWDRNRRVRIDNNNHTLTDVYLEPGYHVAKLYVNDRVVKTADVSIPTNGWFFYSKETLSRGVPAYIHDDHPFHNGILGLDRAALAANRIDPEKPQIYLYTWFPARIFNDADNFRLTARIRMTEVRNTACPFIMSEIYCQKGFMYGTYTVPGCTGGISAQFGDQVVDGKKNDLSALAFDVSKWHDLQIVVRDRRASVYIDGLMAMTKPYTESAGLITGLGFHSNGLCEVDSIRLTGLDGKLVYPAAD